MSSGDCLKPKPKPQKWMGSAGDGLNSSKFTTKARNPNNSLRNNKHKQTSRKSFDCSIPKAYGKLFTDPYAYFAQKSNGSNTKQMGNGMVMPPKEWINGYSNPSESESYSEIKLDKDEEVKSTPKPIKKTILKRDKCVKSDSISRDDSNGSTKLLTIEENRDANAFIHDDKRATKQPIKKDLFSLGESIEKLHCKTVKEVSFSNAELEEASFRSSEVEEVQEALNEMLRKMKSCSNKNDDNLFSGNNFMHISVKGKRSLSNNIAKEVDNSDVLKGNAQTDIFQSDNASPDVILNNLFNKHVSCDEDKVCIASLITRAFTNLFESQLLLALKQDEHKGFSCVLTSLLSTLRNLQCHYSKDESLVVEEVKSSFDNSQCSLRPLTSLLKDKSNGYNKFQSYQFASKSEVKGQNWKGKVDTTEKPFRLNRSSSHAYINGQNFDKGNKNVYSWFKNRHYVEEMDVSEPSQPHHPVEQVSKPNGKFHGNKFNEASGDNSYSASTRYADEYHDSDYHFRSVNSYTDQPKGHNEVKAEIYKETSSNDESVHMNISHFIKEKYTGPFPTSKEKNSGDACGDEEPEDKCYHSDNVDKVMNKSTWDSYFFSSVNESCEKIQYNGRSGFRSFNWNIGRGKNRYTGGSSKYNGDFSHRCKTGIPILDFPMQNKNWINKHYPSPYLSPGHYDVPTVSGDGLNKIDNASSTNIENNYNGIEETQNIMKNLKIDDKKETLWKSAFGALVLLQAGLKNNSTEHTGDHSDSQTSSRSEKGKITLKTTEWLKKSFEKNVCISKEKRNHENEVVGKSDTDKSPVKGKTSKNLPLKRKRYQVYDNEDWTSTDEDDSNCCECNEVKGQDNKPFPEFEACVEILTRIWNSKLSSCFKHKVSIDEVNCDSSNPNQLLLDNIVLRLNNGVYKNAIQFIQDMKYIFNSNKEPNEGKVSYKKCAEVLNHEFNALLLQKLPYQKLKSVFETIKCEVN